MKHTHFLILVLFSLSLFSCNKNKCKERIIRDCVATLQNDPVCGCNGKTYGNSSIAKCSGIEKYTKGKCPD